MIDSHENYIKERNTAFLEPQVPVYELSLGESLFIIILMKYKYSTEGTGQMLDDHCCTCADSSLRYSEHAGIWQSQLKHKSDKECQEEW